MTCFNCSNQFKPKNYNKGNKFCTLKCSHEYKKTQRDLEVSQATNYQGFGLLVIKRLIKAKQENKCRLCGLSTWLDKPLMLILDHIDGNSNNLQADNFRLICSNCDATLPTYKKRNVGNGRFYRKQRYKEGKSS